MSIRIASIDDDMNLPPSVRARIAENLKDPTTPEGEAIEELLDEAVAAPDDAAVAGLIQNPASSTASAVTDLAEAVAGPIAEAAIEGRFDDLVANPEDSVVSILVSDPASQTAAALNSTLVAREDDGANADDPQRWYIGPKTVDYPKGQLYLEFHNNWLAQRLSLGGIWTAAARTAPTFEIFPAVPAYRPDLPGYAEGVGANNIDPVTCLQVYRLGHGDLADREYWYVEPHGAQNGGEFVAGVWSSGTGQVRPYRHRAGNIYAFTISPGAVFTIDRQLIVDVGTVDNDPMIVRKNRDYHGIRVEQYNAASTGPKLMLIKHRGTVAARTSPLLNDILGDVQMGALDSSGPVIGAIVRAMAQENWNPTVAQGAKLQLIATKAGTATRDVVAQFDVPTVVLDSSARLVYWNGSALVEKRVIVGAADSGGTGFRALRVTN